MKAYQRAVFAIVAIFFGLGALYSLYGIWRTTPVMAEVTTLPPIVIDPGHGGGDGGAVGVDDIVEKDINLGICLTLRDIFTANGFDVVMTRSTDISTHDEGITGVRKQKTSDLHNRLALVETTPGAIFFSVHQNKFKDSRSRGAQIFYGPQNEQSQKLANILQENFTRELQPDNHRQIKQAEKNLYLVHTAPCPSVLIECGFLSNREEAHLLTDPEYQSKIAFVVFRSAMEFIDMDVPAVPGG